MQFRLPTLLLLLYLAGSAYGQGPTRPLLPQQPKPGLSAAGIHGLVELGGLVSDVAQTPFWLRTNQYGIVPLGGSAGT